MTDRHPYPCQGMNMEYFFVLSVTFFYCHFTFDEITKLMSKIVT